MKALVPEIRRPLEMKLLIDKVEVRDYIQQELSRVREEYPPLAEDDPFLGGLTVREYFALPDEERERIWNRTHAMEIEDFKEHEVKPNAYVPARQKRRP